MMTCKQAVRLMSEEMDRDLATGERFSLHLHILICLGCHRYRRQMSFLRQACRQQVAPDGDAAPPG